jgi:hypothetical protein
VLHGKPRLRKAFAQSARDFTIIFDEQDAHLRFP